MKNILRDEENKRIGFYIMQNVDIENDTIIYHYMDIEHLCYLLDNASFHLNKKCNFEDKKESELLDIKLRFAFSIVVDNAPPQNTEEIQNNIEKNRALFKKRSTTLTSCWSEGPSENILMWRSYTKQNSGVCIKTTIGKFVESMKYDNYDIYCGKIKYERRGQTTKEPEAEWMKDPEYFGEKEIRFYFLNSHATTNRYNNSYDNVFIGIDYRTLINEIILSPYMWKDEAERWKKHISETYSIDKRKIQKSKIELNI